MQKLNGKIIYAAGLILVIGLIYLFAQVSAFFSVGSTRIEGDVIEVSKSEILTHMRTLLIIMLCFSGGFLLLKLKTAGWVITQSVLFLFLAIATGIYLSNINAFSISGVVLIAGIVILLLAIIFLLLAQTRNKFLVGRKQYVQVLILFLALAAFNFFLQ